jgi:hypothetical protein
MVMVFALTLVFDVPRLAVSQAVRPLHHQALALKDLRAIKAWLLHHSAADVEDRTFRKKRQTAFPVAKQS